MDLLVKKNFLEAVTRFDAPMKKALPELTLRQTWAGLEGQVGLFQKQVRHRTEKLAGYDIVFVTCQFQKAVLDAKVVFNSRGEISGLFFVPAVDPAALDTPPPYARTNSFRESDVTVGQGKWKLPGTLSVPTSGVGPWPAVVLVHGSGPNDRDETVLANKPFRDLAWGLASKRVAVLRYEKRTREHAASMRAVVNTLTLQEETIDDALSAVRLLRETGGIDAKRVFVLGHSLGGFAAPRIATADADLAGVIIMAGSTRRLEEIILDQHRYLLSLKGASSAEDRSKLAEVQAEVAKIKRLTTADASSSLTLLNAPACYWLDLRAYDAPAMARALKQPLLILQGQRDYQVTMADLEGWKTALGASPAVSFKLYSNLNHLFMPGEGQSTPADYEKPGHVEEVVVSDIADWIKSR